VKEEMLKLSAKNGGFNPPKAETIKRPKRLRE
jgi:hypothetical protein